MMGRHADLGFSASTLLVLRGVFVLLSLCMATTIIYTCSTDGSPFRSGEVGSQEKTARTLCAVLFGAICPHATQPLPIILDLISVSESTPLPSRRAARAMDDRDADRFLHQPARLLHVSPDTTPLSSKTGELHQPVNLHIFSEIQSSRPSFVSLRPVQIDGTGRVPWCRVQSSHTR